MPQDSEASSEKPILHPHIISKLKDRPRVVDFGVRRDALAQLENQLAERRTPKNVAKRTSRRAMSEAKDVGQNVMSNRMENVLNAVSNHSVTNNARTKHQHRSLGVQA